MVQCCRCREWYDDHRVPVSKFVIPRATDMSEPCAMQEMTSAVVIIIVVVCTVAVHAVMQISNLCMFITAPITIYHRPFGQRYQLEHSLGMHWFKMLSRRDWQNNLQIQNSMHLYVSLLWCCCCYACCGATPADIMSIQGLPPHDSCRSQQK